MNLVLHDVHFHITDNILNENKNLNLNQINSQSLFLLNGTEVKNWEKVINLSLNISSIIPFIGIHPWYIKNTTNDYLNILENYLKIHHNLGIGEIGLDNSNRCRNEEPEFIKQEEVFYNQLLLAIRYNRPISFHVVKRWDIFFDIINQNAPEKFMIHGFSQSKEIAKRILDLGGFISLGIKSLTKESNYATIRWLPSDRILIESDATISVKDIFSETHNNEINSTYNLLAKIRNVNVDTLASNINNNIHYYLSSLNMIKRS